MATIAAPLICPKGHGPGIPGAQFCTACGGQLVAPAPPVGAMAAGQSTPLAAIPTTLAPAVQQGSPPQGWTPVHQASAPLQPSTPNQAPAVPPATIGAVPAAAGAPWTAAVPPSGKPAPAVCTVCGGNGARLDEETIVCTGCSWLRPLLPGYQLDRSVFLWAQDGQAMAKLQSISALHSVVKTVSDKVGRPWIESTFNAIRLGPKQLPDVWNQAVLAARVLGLPKMPDVYISGDQMWNTYTYGTETSSFIVLGTSHLINFANDEMFFVLAREMGHCRAGHAVWKTVTRFLAGDVAVHSGILSNGLLNAISPTKLIEGALDLPLMAWSRQSDVTADRAGLLAVGDEALARRVLLAWSIRSARLLQQVNIEEWMKQEDTSDDQMTKFTEMTTSASMYTTRRLRLLGQAAREPELMRWSNSIQPIRKKLAPAAAQMMGLGVGTVKVVKAAAPAAGMHVRAGSPAGATPATTISADPAASPAAATQSNAGPHAAALASAAAAPVPSDSFRVVCNKCQTAMRIPRAVLRGKTSLNVRCPHCQNIFMIRPKAASPQVADGAQTKPIAPPPAGTGVETKPIAPPTAPGAAKAMPAAPAPVHAGVQTKPVASPPASAGAKTTSVARPPAPAGRKK